MNVTFTETVMNWFHEVNELYYGTLNKVRNLFYSTDIKTNKTFTFCGSVKEQDRLSFFDATEKEIHDHEEGSLGCRSLQYSSQKILPNKINMVIQKET